MRNWRVLTAVLAVVFGAAAAAGTYYYVNNADERARAKMEFVDVLVAASAIPRGTTGADALGRGLVGMRARVRSDVPESARVDPASIRGLVAAASIDAGSIVTQSSFITVAQAGSGGLAANIDKAAGKQAFTLSVDLQHGVAGLISVNDTVNVIVSTKIADPVNTGEVTTSNVTAYLIPGLKVLAVGTSTATSQPSVGGSSDTTGASPPQSSAGATGQNVGLLTVEVTPRQAEQLAHVYAAGSPVYLTLSPTGFDPKKVQVPAEIVESFNLFDQPLEVLRQWQTSVPKS